MNEITDLLRQSELFRDLSEEDLNLLASCTIEVCLTKGYVLFKEDDQGQDLFLVSEGALQVSKTDQKTGRMYNQAVLKPGDTIGEMAFIDNKARAAHVTALEDAKVLKIDFRRTNDSKVRALKTAIQSKIANLLVQRLRQHNQVALFAQGGEAEQEGARIELGDFVIKLIGLIFLYIYAIKTIEVIGIKFSSTAFVSIPVLSVYAISMLYLVKKSGRPLSLYGLNLNNFRKNLLESFLFTSPILIVIFLFRYIMIHNVPKLHDLPLFSISSGTLENLEPFLLMISYLLFVPVQEFIYRGAIQGSFEQLLVGKKSTLQSILISNLPFSLIHLHLNLAIALIIYFYGLFWGWMFARQRTLVGCSFSHFLLGLWGFFIVGVEDLL